jgi:hypothetical protein
MPPASSHTYPRPAPHQLSRPATPLPNQLSHAWSTPHPPPARGRWTHSRLAALLACRLAGLPPCWPAALLACRLAGLPPCWPAALLACWLASSHSLLAGLYRLPSPSPWPAVSPPRRRWSPRGPPECTRRCLLEEIKLEVLHGDMQSEYSDRKSEYSKMPSEYSKMPSEYSKMRSNSPRQWSPHSCLERAWPGRQPPVYGPSPLDRRSSGQLAYGPGPTGPQAPSGMDPRTPVPTESARIKRTRVALVRFLRLSRWRAHANSSFITCTCA